MKNSAAKMLSLSKNQIRLFLKNKSSVVCFILLTSIVIIVNSFGIVIIKGEETSFTKLTKINIMILLNALQLGFLTILLTINSFIMQTKNNICKIELRYGFKIREIYFSRIFTLLLVVFSAFFIDFLFSVIVFVLINKNKDILSYRLYISSFGWYAILIISLLTITVFVSKFFNETSTSFICTVIPLFIIFLPSIGIIFKLDETDSNKYLISYKVHQKINETIENNETLKSIANEVGLIENSDIIYGFEENVAMDNYIRFESLIAEKLNKGKQFSTWWPKSSKNNLEDPLLQITEKLLKESDLKPYYDIFFLFKDIYSNNSFAKTEGFINNHWIAENYDEEIIFLEKKFKTPDNYLFNRYFLNTLQIGKKNLFELQTDFLPSSSKLDVPPRKAINSALVANILNPINHLNLMFWGIDYQNEVATSFYSTKQFIFKSPRNLNFSSNLNKNSWAPWPNLQIYLLVRPEIFYLIYFGFNVTTLYFGCASFGKKIKK